MVAVTRTGGKLGCIAVLILLSQVLAPIAAAGGAQSGASGQSATTDVSLFFHSSTTGNNTLDTRGPATGPPLGEAVTTKEFTLAPALAEDLTVQGHDTGNGVGFWVRNLNIQATPFASTRITIAVDGGARTVAGASFDLNRGEGSTTWDIPFGGGQTSVQLYKGEPFRVRINGSATFILTTQSNSNITVRCSSTSFSFVTRDWKGAESDRFQPNAPDALRVVKVTGTVSDAFGPQDVRSAYVTVKNPSGAVAASGNSNLTNGSFDFSWAYSRGQPGGRYNVTVTVRDLQDHSVEAYGNIIMADYGLYLNVKGMDQDGRTRNSTVPGSSASYAVEVYNTGNQPTGATFVTVGVVADGFTPSFNPPKITGLQPGDKTDVVLTVAASSDRPVGETGEVKFEASADSDPEAPKATSNTIISLTKIGPPYGLKIEVQGEAEKTVDVGGSAVYSIVVTNTGQLKVTVDLSYTTPASNWLATLSTLRLPDMEPTGEQTVTLSVTAPNDTSSQNSTTVDVVGSIVGADPPVSRSVKTTTASLGTGFTMEVVPPTIRESDPAKSGGKVDFTLKLTNTHPTRDVNIQLTAQPPRSDWTAIAFGGKVGPYQTGSIPPGGTVLRTVSITPPTSALADAAQGYRVGIVASRTDSPGMSRSTEVWVKVKERYDLRLEAPEKSRDIRPDGTITYQFRLTSSGNTNVSVVIILRGVPAGWTASSSVQQFQMAPNATNTFQVTIKAPPASASGARRGTQAKVEVMATVTELDKSPSVTTVTTLTKSLTDSIMEITLDNVVVLLLAIMVVVVYGVGVRRVGKEKGVH